MDCINKGPVWINNDDWNQMIKDIGPPLNFEGDQNLQGVIS
jgi:hypothetical protein